MLNFKDKIAEQVEIINDNISDENEKVRVLKSLEKIITEFTTHIIQLKEQQDELNQEVINLRIVLIF